MIPKSVDVTLIDSPRIIVVRKLLVICPAISRGSMSSELTSRSPTIVRLAVIPHPTKIARKKLIRFTGAHATRAPFSSISTCQNALQNSHSEIHIMLHMQINKIRSCILIRVILPKRYLWRLLVKPFERDRRYIAIARLPEKKRDSIVSIDIRRNFLKYSTHTLQSVVYMSVVMSGDILSQTPKATPVSALCDKTSACMTDFFIKSTEPIRGQIIAIPVPAMSARCMKS